MAYFCAHCGKQLDESTAFCPQCGTARGGSQPQGIVYQQVVYVKDKVPGRGFGITSLVLGIAGLFYSLVLVLLMATLSFAPFPGVYYYMGIAAATTIAVIIYATPSILAVIFGAVSKKRGYLTGIRTAGSVTGYIGVCLCVLSILLLIIGAL